MPESPTLSRTEAIEQPIRAVPATREKVSMRKRKLSLLGILLVSAFQPSLSTADHATEPEPHFLHLVKNVEQRHWAMFGEDEISDLAQKMRLDLGL